MSSALTLEVWEAGFGRNVSPVAAFGRFFLSVLVGNHHSPQTLGNAERAFSFFFQSSFFAMASHDSTDYFVANHGPRFLLLLARDSVLLGARIEQLAQQTRHLDRKRADELAVVTQGHDEYQCNGVDYQRKKGEHKRRSNNNNKG